jgi:hypothetical protein
VAAAGWVIPRGLAAGSVPAELTVKIAMAAVAFDRTIETRSGAEVGVAVVGRSGRSEELMSVLRSYSDKKIKGKSMRIVGVNVADFDKVDGLAVAFFAEALAADAPRIAGVCKQKQITCISADEGGVADGLALGIEMTEDGKPRLLINLDAAKSAGSDFPAQVLKLARLVEGK